MLGQCLRTFVKKTCHLFETHELPSECRKRQRRKAAQSEKAARSGKAPPTNSKQKAPETSERPTEESEAEPRRKALNLCTYKLHALGDYVANIFRYGTSDNYTTKLVHFIKNLLQSTN